LGQAFVQHDPRNLQPELFRQFFDAHGESLKLQVFLCLHFFVLIASSLLSILIAKRICCPPVK
jgi:hypothetical protein